MTIIFFSFSPGSVALKRGKKSIGNPFEDEDRLNTPAGAFET